MPCRVRRMRQEDILQIVAIDREAFPSLTPTNYHRELKNQLARYIVAIEGESVAGDEGRTASAIVGFAGFWIMAGDAHIVNIAVRQSCRRQGIGELLLIGLIDLALELQAHLITLEVRVSNTAAQSLYSKYGFVIKGLRRGYYSDEREDGVIMTVADIGSATFRSRFSRLKQAHAGRWNLVQRQAVHY